MASTVYFYALFIVIVLSIYLANSTTETRQGGFSIDLIHRDSPKSPLYNPNETPLERYNNAFRRANSRLNRYITTSFHPADDAQIQVAAENGQYLMKLSIGTPPVDIYGIVDTGSDLMWTQCLPCAQCYKQINPIYDPKASSSYSDISCKSDQCHLLDTVSCSPQNLCNYTYGYASNALTQGALATETITIGSDSGQPISFNNIVFGCGHNNTGFNEHEMGLVGLGGRPLSLMSQLSSQIGSRKFSTCLVPFGTDPDITSKIHIGSSIQVSGDGVVSTPLIPKDDPTYRYVTLQGISVGDKFVAYSDNVSTGNMFIDTGVPPTIIPEDFYNRLEQEVRKSIPMTPYQDPQLGTQLCYQSKTVINAPILTAHFEGDAKVPLVPTSTFISPKEGVFCFAMTTTDSDIGIIGNFAQSNLLISYDIDNKIVSFKPTDCTKQQ